MARKRQDFAWMRDNIINVVDDNPIRREHVIFTGENFVPTGIGLETSHATAVVIKKIIAEICLEVLASVGTIAYKVIATWIRKKINDVTDYTTQYLAADDDRNDIMGQKSCVIVGNATTLSTSTDPLRFDIDAQRALKGDEELVLYVEWFDLGGGAPSAGAQCTYNVQYSVGIARDL